MAILVFAAHPDDEVLGAGGTIAKLSRESEDIISVIFSYGEGSDPVREPESLIQERVRESKKAGKILNTKETFFLGLSDSKFVSEAGQPSTRKKLQDILNKYQPKKIYIHSIDDPHPAPRETARVVKEVLKEMHMRVQVYSFTISMPLKFTRRDSPRVFVDITKEFDKKMSALRVFKSQELMLKFYFIPLMRVQAWLAGFKAHCKYAEVFYKW